MALLTWGRLRFGFPTQVQRMVRRILAADAKIYDENLEETVCVVTL